MIRRILLVCSVAIPAAGDVAAQAPPAPATRYTFVSGTADVRALWVNPAGLGVVPEASVFAEFLLDRSSGDLRTEQYSFGINSRGVSFGYQRNRPVGGSAVGVLRAGTAFPFSRGALGVAVSRYSQDSTSSRAADVGVMYVATTAFQFGAAARNIGRPTVQGAQLPLTAVTGIQWSTTRVQLAGEGHAAEAGPGDSGVNLSYRAGARLVVLDRLPLIAIAVAESGTNGRLRRLHFGAALGGVSRVTAVGSIVERNGKPTIDRLSAAFLSVNQLGAR